MPEHQQEANWMWRSGTDKMLDDPDGEKIGKQQDVYVGAHVHEASG